MSRRLQDMKAEQELSIYLDKYFYPKISVNGSIKSIDRITDINLQMKGVDVQISFYQSTNILYLDEKAQLYYINNNLPTFAFEIDFLNRSKQLTQGWLYNPNYITDYYLLIYPNAVTSNISEITHNDFTNTELLFISRNAILDYLHNNGLDMNNIIQISNDIRLNNKYGKTLIPNVNDFWFILSDSKFYSETPLNIVIRRKVLNELALHIYSVNQNIFNILK